MPKSGSGLRKRRRTNRHAGHPKSKPKSTNKRTPERTQEAGLERPTVSSTANVAVVLRTSDADLLLEWSNGPGGRMSEAQRGAIEWSHVVRNRRRWTRSEESIQEQAERAREFLGKLGLNLAERKKLAKAGRVEVAMRYQSEKIGWEARIMPWEFLLSAATRDLRQGPLAVSRWLERKNTPTPALSDPTVLYLESVPARLAAEYDFESERRLVEASTRASRFELLQNPTRETLVAKLKDVRPGILHMAGFDTHQGLALLEDPRAKLILDGYLMCDENNLPDPVSAQDFAGLLTEAGHGPALVVCNIWNSAARTAPLAVAAGAAAAIGFQDAFDDALSELFIGAFYDALGETSSDAMATFDAAWGALRAQPKSVQGTGIALWQGGTREASRRKARSVTRPPTSQLSELVIDSKLLSSEQACDTFAITVEPVEQISYALLHNNRDLFDRFLIRKLKPGRADFIAVHVELSVGNDSYPFRQTFVMKGPPLDLSRKVRIALTSALARSVDELLRTSLFVEVTWGTHVLFRQTFPVTLQPVDQWADTDTDRLFLPSFVFPRDAAVAKIISCAQRYVTALRDDPAAGFDGYQSLDPEAEDPAFAVDAQVQAIWYALTFELPLGYINPPPTYSTSGQRLRTPAEVIGGGRGTCIDLALLMASCLELVDIYPVVFLLVDHAFPGYWRSDEAHDAFINRICKLSDGTPDDRQQGVAALQRPEETWYFTKRLLFEIRKEVAANRLIPLETVGLTDRSSFDTAISDSRKYFKNAVDFDSMIDIVFARQCRVTPIPLLRQ